MVLPAHQFETSAVHPIDIHTMEDLLLAHKDNQKSFDW